MNILHVFFQLPNQLEAFPANLACLLLHVDLALLAIVNKLNMRFYVAILTESFSADFARIFFFASVDSLCSKKIRCR